MEIRVLQYFLKIAELENITKAAEALHITQPALSRQLSELEEELGTKLFLRGKRKTVLTEDGQLLQTRAREIASLIHKTKDEIKHGENQISGSIRIGCAETRGMQYLLHLQKELLDAHPHLCCHLYDGNDEDVMEKLDKGLLDFGVLSSPSHLRHYEFLRLPHQDYWCLLMRKDDSLAKKDILSPQDLWSIPLILSRQALESGEISHLLQKEISALYITGTYNLIFNASIMVEEGIGYAIAYEHLVHTGNDAPLTFRPIAPRHPADTYFIWKQNQIFSPATKLLKTKVEEQVKQEKQVSEGSQGKVGS